jgi:hypothetical protein
MFRFFARNRDFTDKRVLSGRTNPFKILDAGRASIHPDGVVFLNIQRGVIFKSNRVGSRIWQGVQNQQSPSAIASQISREYAVPEEQAANDTAQFLAQLEAEGFLVRNVPGRHHEV